MALTFTQLKTDLAARGFDDYSDATLGLRINAARAELDRMYLWPWREESTTGTSPLSIPDLGTIEAVTNETLDQVLVGAQYRNLLDWYGGDLSLSATPTFYYVAWPSGTPVVATYPSNSHTIGVQYWKVTADLSAGGDTPAAPAELHPLIVDLATVRAYRDKDNREAARELRAEVKEQLLELLNQYPCGVADDAGHYVSGYGSDG